MANVQVIQRHAHLASAVKLEFVNGREGKVAKAVLIANHPSGAARPSRADEVLTQTLKQAAALVDVRVLDHFIVAGDAVNSMAEQGLV